MTGAQPQLLVVLAQLLMLEGKRGHSAATTSEPCNVHLHAIIESEDGGRAGGGRAPLQIANALVQVLPRQQHCFGGQVL